jgi:hypothetical protein
VCVVCYAFRHIACEFDCVLFTYKLHSVTSSAQIIRVDTICYVISDL